MPKSFAGSLMPDGPRVVLRGKLRATANRGLWSMMRHKDGIVESKEFDDLLKTARETGMLLAYLLEGAADAGVDLRRAMRNIRPWSLVLALGTAAFGGWWLARRQQLRVQPPQPTPQEAARAFIEDTGSKLFKRVEDALGRQQAFEAIERLIPEHIEPEAMVEEAGARAKLWVDTVLEPRLKEGLDNVNAGLADTPLNGWLRQARRFVEQDGADDTKDEE